MTQQEFLNRYQYDVSTDYIGGGSFGSVYKAFDTALDRWVAIKVSEVKHIAEKEFSLKEEKEAINSIPAHKNIANYEDVYRFKMPNGVFDYAIMQYYSLGNMKQLVKNNKLNKTQKHQLLVGILEGLEQLHKEKVVHRDLKPSNILISKRIINNQTVYIPKISDFGLSKQTTSEQTQITNSFGGGTLEYSAPEQLLGERIRFNTDLWALGVIAYQLFTKELPFKAQRKSGSDSTAREHEIYNKIVNAELPAKVEEVPLTYQQLIINCLEKDASERVKTAEELLILLGERRGEDIEDTAIKVPKEPAKKKHRYLQYIQITLLLSIIGLVLTTAWRRIAVIFNIKDSNITVLAPQDSSTLVQKNEKDSLSIKKEPVIPPINEEKKIDENLLKQPKTEAVQPKLKTENNQGINININKTINKAAPIVKEEGANFLIDKADALFAIAQTETEFEAAVALYKRVEKESSNGSHQQRATTGQTYCNQAIKYIYQGGRKNVMIAGFNKSGYTPFMEMGDNQQWGIMKKYGEVVVPRTYMYVVQLPNEWFQIGTEDRKMGLVNPKGKIIKEAIYDMFVYLEDHNCFMEMKDENALVSLWRIKGNELEQFTEKYTGIAFLEDKTSRAIVYNGEQYGAIDKTGKVIIPLIYEDEEEVENLLK